MIVALVYHVALKPIWNPEGMQMILSEIRHTFILWIISDNKKTIELKRLLK